MAIRNAAKAIILHNGKVLLNKYAITDSEIHYGLPGGGQNQFETMEEAVIRECLEETGYNVRPVRFAAILELIYDDEEIRRKYIDYAHKIFHIFIVELADTTRYEPTETDQNQIESQWIDIKDVAGLDIRPRLLKNNIEKIIASESPMYLGIEYE